MIGFIKNLFAPHQPEPLSKQEMAQIVERMTGQSIKKIFTHAESVTITLTKRDKVLFEKSYQADDRFGGSVFE